MKASTPQLVLEPFAQLFCLLSLICVTDYEHNPTTDIVAAADTKFLLQYSCIVCSDQVCLI